MNVELQELRAFAAVAGALHFGEAARRTGVSQPALSKQIRRLEAKLGGELFSRHTRGVTLTAAGAALRDRALRLLADAARFEESAQMAVRGEAGALRIGLGLSAMARGLPAVLQQYRKRYPQVRVTVSDMSSARQAAALRQDEIDVGFLRLPALDSEDLQVAPVIEERLEIVTHAQDRLRGGLAGLARRPFVLLSRAVSPSFHDHVLAACRSAGFSPRVEQEANQIYNVLTLVSAGMGVTLAPSSARSMRVAGVRFCSAGMGPTGRWLIGLAWRKGEGSAAVRNFTSLARDHFRVSRGSVVQ